MTILILDVDPSSPALWGFAIDPKLSLADIIASLTLLATVVIAWAAGRSAMKQWRVQRRLEKAADVAEQAMAAVNQLTNFLQAMAHGVYFGAQQAEPVGRQSRIAPILVGDHQGADRTRSTTAATAHDRMRTRAAAATIRARCPAHPDAIATPCWPPACASCTASGWRSAARAVPGWS